MKGNFQILTQDQLKLILKYDSNSGLLYWIRNNKLAGYIHNIEGYRRLRINGKMYRQHRLVWMLDQGVHEFNGKFKSQIRTNLTYKYLGTFDTPEEAYNIYIKTKRELHI